MEKIYVTKPSLPPIDEYIPYLEKIWESNHLTNFGPFHQKLEDELCKFLGVKYVSLFNNATIALLVAQRILGFKGEIITTPYSFIATAHSLKWNDLEPSFVDTDHDFGNITEKMIRKNVNKKTGGILAVHNFGIPGELELIEKLAEELGLPLLYDAAPALGVKYKNKSLLNYGDLAVLSFHATKVFTTFEGGAIVSHSSNVKKEIDQLKNFAILGVEDVGGLGINGKMNEAEAAMGLLQLKYINRNLEKRKRIFEKYNDSFSNDRNVRIPIIPNTVEYNYAYFPLYFKKGISIRDKVYEGLIKKNVFCRKYWYPLITDFEIYSNCRKTELINAKSLSDSTLCLPIYPDLTQNQQEYIINEIKELF